jgi:anti-anti-sigma regulatory factor
MFQVQADTVKNRLYIVLTGVPTAGEAKQAADAVAETVKKLKPGFSVINDASNLKPVDPAGAKEIIRAQHAIKEAGVGRVIRVVGDAALVKMQFRRTGMEAGYDQGAEEIAASVQEAEQLLDKK